MSVLFLVLFGCMTALGMGYILVVALVPIAVSMWESLQCGSPGERVFNAMFILAILGMIGLVTTIAVVGATPPTANIKESP